MPRGGPGRLSHVARVRRLPCLSFASFLENPGAWRTFCRERSHSVFGAQSPIEVHATRPVRSPHHASLHAPAEIDAGNPWDVAVAGPGCDNRGSVDFLQRELDRARGGGSGPRETDLQSRQVPHAPSHDGCDVSLLHQAIRSKLLRGRALRSRAAPARASHLRGGRKPDVDAGQRLRGYGSLYPGALAVDELYRADPQRIRSRASSFP